MSQTYVNIITRILKVSIRKNRRKSQQKIILCANIMVPSRNLKVPHTRRCRTMAEKESSGPEDWETQFWVGLRRVFTSSYPLLFILLSLLLSPPTSSKKTHIQNERCSTNKVGTQTWASIETVINYSVLGQANNAASSYFLPHQPYRLSPTSLQVLLQVYRKFWLSTLSVSFPHDDPKWLLHELTSKLHSDVVSCSSWHPASCSPMDGPANPLGQNPYAIGDR